MITKIRLKNFKCFEDETFKLSSLNLWTGLNGMGKSTAIQSLLLLRQNFEQGLLENNKGMPFNGELVTIGTAKDLLYQHFKDPQIGIDMTTDRDIAVGWIWAAGTNNDILPIMETKGELGEFFKTGLFGTNFLYINAEGLGSRVYSETSTYSHGTSVKPGLRGKFVANYLAESQNTPIPIPQLKHPSATGLSLLEQVNAWMGEIRPGAMINISSNLEVGLMGLTYQLGGGTDTGKRFHPAKVGFGLSFLLPILVAVLSSTPGSFVILENPETHLHPRGQAVIGKLLAIAAANGVQIIVETHSDHILNGVRVAVKKQLISPEQTSLLFFHGEVSDDQFKHYILNPKIDKNGRIDQWPDGFFDEWDRQLNELL